MKDPHAFLACSEVVGVSHPGRFSALTAFFFSVFGHRICEGGPKHVQSNVFFLTTLLPESVYVLHMPSLRMPHTFR